MSEAWGDTDVIRRVLATCDTWAVVGLGNNPSRAAYGVARFLQQHGKKVVPVHPDAETVLGEPGYATLAEVPFPVDCVDVFRRSEAAGAFADEAVAIGARAVWFQLGVLDHAAFGRATAAGLDVVMDRCPAIEWAANGPR
ncbi:CoA-binding protein [Actinosynnema sp. NPDC020468]|uniref:CoA-binding protein n=1 Tax=Actinosynnema sp. NPDC020468 TaxID=3154488 RepID=UPI0033EBEA56